MRDEIDGRLWIEHGSEFTTAVVKWIEALSAAFIRLNERQYEAPWGESETRRRYGNPA